jgi:hypothetical protein
MSNDRLPAFGPLSDCICILAILLIAAGSMVTTADFASAQMQAGRTVEVTGEQQHQQFVAGDSVRITANIADDVFAAGREVTVDGARTHTLVAGAGRLVIRNSTIRDLIAGGLDIEIRGIVEDDAVVAVCPMCWWASRRILIGKEARIGDDARLFADTIEIEGAIGRNVHAAARRIVISGSIGGKVDLKAQEIVIGPGAKLGAEAVLRSPRKPDISPAATIAGPVREIKTEVEFPSAAELGKALAVGAALLGLAAGLGILLLGGILQAIVPRLLQSGADRIAEQPWANLGYGLAWALITPALVMLLFVTIIGAPAALALIAGFFVLATLGFVTAGYAVGLWVSRRIGRQTLPSATAGRIGWTVLGTFLLMLVNVVPVLGWIVAFMLFITGLGAAASVVVDRFRSVDVG